MTSFQFIARRQLGQGDWQVFDFRLKKDPSDRREVISTPLGNNEMNKQLSEGSTKRDCLVANCLSTVHVSIYNANQTQRVNIVLGRGSRWWCNVIRGDCRGSRLACPSQPLNTMFLHEGGA